MKKAGIFFVFILIGSVLYLNSLKNTFHYDDEHHIVLNPYIKTIKNIPLFFTEPRTFSIRQAFHPHYRPLVLTSYAINYHLGGHDPEGYHMVNLGFHIGSAFLVFLTLQSLLGSSESVTFIPLVAGLLFLTTPFNSEVVNYISARSSVMCSFFYLLAFYFWVKYRSQKPEVRSQKKSYFLPLTSYFYMTSLLSFLLAMLTKEIAITLPLILWLYDNYFLDRNRVRVWRNYLAYIPFAITGLFTGILLRYIFFGQFNIEQDIQAGRQFVTVIKTLPKYFIKALIPSNLSVWHQMARTMDGLFWLSLVGIIFMVVAAYYGWRSGKHFWKVASFFILWFFVVLLPTSILPLMAPFQENRGYISSAGVMIIAAISLEKVRSFICQVRGGGAFTVFAVVLILILYSGGVVKRNQIWFNDLTLWTDVLTKYPGAKEPHSSIGNFYRRQGMTDLAEREYDTVLKIDENDKGANISLGIIYFNRGEMDKAGSYLEKALSASPNEPVIHIYLGKIYEVRGDMDRAFKEYLTAFKYSPDDMNLPDMLVNASARRGDLDIMYRNFSFLRGKDPTNPAVRRTLGLIHQHKGEYELAAGEYKAVLSLVPGHIRTLMNLGDIYFETGRYDLAEKVFMQVLEIRPSYSKASTRLASVREKRGLRER